MQSMLWLRPPRRTRQHWIYMGELPNSAMYCCVLTEKIESAEKSFTHTTCKRSVIITGRCISIVVKTDHEG